ncbi:MAG: PAS domain-containing protein [Sphingomonadales bacterium]
MSKRPIIPDLPSELTASNRRIVVYIALGLVLSVIAVGFMSWRQQDAAGQWAVRDAAVATAAMLGARNASQSQSVEAESGGKSTSDDPLQEIVHLDLVTPGGVVKMTGLRGDDDDTYNFLPTTLLEISLRTVVSPLVDTVFLVDRQGKPLARSGTLASRLEAIVLAPSRFPPTVKNGEVSVEVLTAPNHPLERLTVAITPVPGTMSYGVAVRHADFGEEIAETAGRILLVGSPGLVFSALLIFALGHNERRRLRIVADLRLLNNRHRLGLRLARVGLVDWDLDSGHATVTRGWLDMLGMRSSRMMMRASVFLDRIHEQDRARVSDVHLKAASRGDETFTQTYRLVNAVGEIVEIVEDGAVSSSATGRRRLILVHQPTTAQD